MPVFDCQNQLVTFITPVFIKVAHFRMCVLMEQKKVRKFQICVMIRVRAKETTAFQSLFTKPWQGLDLWWQIYNFSPKHNPYGFSFYHKKSI